MTPEPFRNSTEHILAELRRVDLMLRRAVLIARNTRTADGPEEFRGLVITEENVDRMLSNVDFLGETWKMDAPTAAAADAIDRELEILKEQTRQRLELSAQSGKRLALAHLSAVCGLSAAEVDLLLIALAAELEPRYETLFAYLQNDVTRKRPSADLALNLICRKEKEKLFARGLLTAGAPLLHFRIVHLLEESYDRGPTLLRRFLKLDEGVVRFLLGQTPTALASGEIVVPEVDIERLAVSEVTRTQLRALASAIERAGPSPALIQLSGSDDAPLEQAAHALGHAFGRALLVVEVDRVAAEPDGIAAVERDAALWDTILVLKRKGRVPQDAASPDALRATETARTLLRQSSGPVIALNFDLGQGAARAGATVWRVDIEPPDYEGRRDLWREALGEAIPDADPERLADLFPFPGDRIRETAALAFSHAALRDPSNPKPAMADILAAGRSVSTPNLQRYAVGLEPRYGWEDIVLPDDRMRQLKGIAARIEHRRVVHRDWDFGAKMARGRGLSVLFSGPTGTGKTMAAEVVAKALGLQLFQIDLSTVVSKYIGETEQNLSAIFKEAEAGQCLLFFDEADAIFGKRTEVKDAHDRYANIEVNYLLQRIEQYRGIVVLATNFQKNIDEAFLRRLHEVIEFPFPDDASREHIWRLHFPAKAPLDPAVDFGFLATQFKISGGSIRNVALNAAFLAVEEAGAKATITMEHIIESLRGEYQKQGKLVMKTDLGRYAGAGK
jgi:hypothetical protein